MLNDQQTTTVERALPRLDPGRFTAEMWTLTRRRAGQAPDFMAMCDLDGWKAIGFQEVKNLPPEIWEEISIVSPYVIMFEQDLPGQTGQHLWGEASTIVLYVIAQKTLDPERYRR